MPLREAAYRAERPVGRPPDFAKDLHRAQQALSRRQEELRRCQRRQERALGAIHALADDCHPFDRHTGSALDAQEVQRRVAEHFGTLQGVLVEANLGQDAAGTLAKAQGWMVLLVAAVGWFWQVARRRLEEMGTSPEVEQAVLGCLLPGLYWQQAAQRARTAEEQKRLRALGQGLLKAFEARLAGVDAEERAEAEEAAQEVVGLFGRSSSCVEGRNGRLSLHRHAQGKISERRLKALTAVHNYVATRPDGSTAAERFFGGKQRDVFAWLLQRLPDLPRPAAKRPVKPTQIAPAGP